MKKLDYHFGIKKQAKRRTAKKLPPLVKHLLSPKPIVQAAIIVLVLCAGVSALVIQHIHSNPVAKVSRGTSNSSSSGTTICVVGESNCPQSKTSSKTLPKNTTPSTTQQTPTKTTTQAAPAGNTPTYSAKYLYCITGDNGKFALDDLYKETSEWLTSEVNSVTNQVNGHSITTQLGVENLNAYITTANNNYASSYQTYLKGRHYNGYECSVDVPSPTTIPLCDQNGTLSTCIEDITNNDNNWANLINDISNDN